MARNYTLGARGADGNLFQIPQSDIDSIEAYLWQASVFCFPVELPSRLRRSMLSHATLGKSDSKTMIIDRNVASDAVEVILKAERTVVRRSLHHMVRSPRY